MNTLSTGTIAKPHYALNYGLRLDKGTASELNHPRVPILLPDGSVGNMTLHVMNGTADEIKAQLLDSIDAFFDIYAEFTPTFQAQPSVTEARHCSSPFRRLR